MKCGTMAGMRRDRQCLVPQPEPLRFRRGDPSEHLRPFVRNFWVTRCAGTPHERRRQRIVPDGCIDIIFTRNGPTETYRGYVVGTMTRPIFENVAAGAQYVGIRFAPRGFTCLFGRPAHEFTDRTVPLDSLFASSALAVRLAESPGTEASFGILDDHLSSRLSPACSNPRLDAALETISTYQGNITVEQLARITDHSPRHLLRLFRESVGVGPKTYCRIVRFKTALRALRRRSEPDLLQIALEAGYYDQAHFIHEFNTFYGSSPSSIVSVSYNTRC